MESKAVVVKRAARAAAAAAVAILQVSGHLVELPVVVVKPAADYLVRAA
jgi:hypothetical protein